MEQRREEYFAEKALEGAVNDLEETFLDAKNGLVEAGSSVEPLTTFRNSAVETVLKKLSCVFDNPSTLATDRMKELQNRAKALEQDIIKFVDEVDAKLNDARDQNELVLNVEKELAGVSKQWEALATKYESPKDLETAMEDVNQLDVLGNKLSLLPVNTIKDGSKQKKLAKERDNLCSQLEVLCLHRQVFLTFFFFFVH